MSPKDEKHDRRLSNVLREQFRCVRRVFGIKTQEEKTVEYILELGKGVECARQAAGQAKASLDNLNTKIASAVAVNDTAALEDLRASYKLHETEYNQISEYVMGLEELITYGRGKLLASGVLDIVQEHISIGNKAKILIRKIKS